MSELIAYAAEWRGFLAPTSFWINLSPPVMVLLQQIARHSNLARSLSRRTRSSNKAKGLRRRSVMYITHLTMESKLPRLGLSRPQYQSTVHIGRPAPPGSMLERLRNNDTKSRSRNLRGQCHPNSERCKWNVPIGFILFPRPNLQAHCPGFGGQFAPLFDDNFIRGGVTTG